MAPFPAMPIRPIGRGRFTGMRISLNRILLIRPWINGGNSGSGAPGAIPMPPSITPGGNPCGKGTELVLVPPDFLAATRLVEMRLVLDEAERFVAETELVVSAGEEEVFVTEPRLVEPEFVPE